MSERFDVVIIGSGPGGQKAAICAAKTGRRVAIVEKERSFGGACVHHGTIPSKTLRDAAVRVRQLRTHAEWLGAEIPERIDPQKVLGRVDEVVHRYARTVEAQLQRNGVECIHGRAHFVGTHELEIDLPGGGHRRLETEHVVLAAGSAPRTPGGIPVDHEHVLDADSVVSLAYLPQSMIVLGGGVIACEYASVLASLGVEVTLLDRGSRPLAFLDSEMIGHFVREFEAMGGRYLPDRNIDSIRFDGVSQVEVALKEGETLRAEKVFAALGREPCSRGLAVDRAGLTPTDRGVIETDEHGCTAQPHIYAVGDLAGPPALATSAMEQGRRAARHLLGQATSPLAGLLPVGIYSIPEIACVGLTEEAAAEAHGEARIGRARFDEVARSQIASSERGLLKLVADPAGERLLGVHIIGEGSTELVHIGQMALFANARVEDIVENVFNFPTMAEAYRIAALDLLNSGDKPE